MQIISLKNTVWVFVSRLYFLNLCPAPVKFYNLACKIAGAFCKLAYKAGNIFRGTKTAGWDFFFYSIQFFLAKETIHACVYYATCYGINLYIAWCQFFGKSHCKCIDTTFCSRISSFCGSTSTAPYRRNIYYSA